MLDSIKSFFQSTMFPPEEAEPQVRKRDIRLAGCALLLELAYADDEFTEDERQHLESAMRRQYGLDRGQADNLIRAPVQDVGGGTGDPGEEDPGLDDGLQSLPAGHAALRGLLPGWAASTGRDDLRPNRSRRPER